MPHRSDLTYEYDGSFDGFMCCIFEHYDKREMPLGIQPASSAVSPVFGMKYIETDAARASRVYDAIRSRISAEAQELVDLCFLTCLPEKEMHLLRFLRRGFATGNQVMALITDDTVHRLQKAVGHLRSEAHKLSGFVRFSVCADVLVAVIEPKNHVLPLLQPHFCDRYSGEAFMIYDRSHRSALVHRPAREGKPCEAMIADIEEYDMPTADPSEAAYRRLWRRFYDTIAVEGRINPRCRMSHMPKRYWKHLTEFAADDEGAGPPRIC